MDLFVDIREKTLRDLSREATLNRLVILDALFAYAEMEDEHGEDVISLEEEDEDEEEEEEEERVVPLKTRKRKWEEEEEEEEEKDNYEDQKASKSKQVKKNLKKSTSASSPSLSIKAALPFSCQIPDCDRVGINFHGATEADRRAAGEAHIKSKHQEYVDEFRQLGGRLCDTCGIGYEGTNAGIILWRHRKLHDSRDWKECTFCPYSYSEITNVTRHILVCSMNPDRNADRAPPTVKCKHCHVQVGTKSMSQHLGAHHGIGKFYKCLFCDFEMYDKQALVNHIFNNHKDKPTITSKEVTHDIVYADSFPFVMRNGNGGRD
jgi:hypothetical protein